MSQKKNVWCVETFLEKIFKVSNRPMDFNVTKYKKFIMASDSILQLTIKNYLLPSFGVISNNIHNYLKKLPKH